MDRVDSSLYSLDTCRLLGIMLSCGQMTMIETSVFVKSEFIPFIRSFLPAEHFFHQKVWQHKPKLIHCFWKTTSTFPIDMMMMYSSESITSKRIQNEVLQLPLEKLSMFLSGFLQGNAMIIDDYYKLRIYSPVLAENIGTLLVNLGLPYNSQYMTNVDLLTYAADAKPMSFTHQNVKVYDLKIQDVQTK
jgi:hypothetical protein